MILNLECVQPLEYEASMHGKRDMSSISIIYGLKRNAHTVSGLGWFVGLPFLFLGMEVRCKRQSRFTPST